MIEAFYFNNDRNFAIYHPPSDQGSSKILVICPPLFDDYLRCYKGLVDLANGAASNGVHVLRFDYLGTGESFGELADASVGQWIEDIVNAIDEGIMVTGAENVSLCGIRFGGTLAAQVEHNNVEKYVLWDPIDAGVELLEQLDQANRQLEQDHVHAALNFGMQKEEIPYELIGMSDEMVSDIKKLTFDPVACEERARCSVVTTSKAVSMSNKYKRCIYTNFEYVWPNYGGGIIYPKPILKAIIEEVI